MTTKTPSGTGQQERIIQRLIQEVIGQFCLCAQMRARCQRSQCEVDIIASTIEMGKSIHLHICHNRGEICMSKQRNERNSVANK